MLNFFMKGSRMTLRHEKIQHLPSGRKKQEGKILWYVQASKDLTCAYKGNSSAVCALTNLCECLQKLGTSFKTEGRVDLAYLKQVHVPLMLRRGQQMHFSDTKVMVCFGAWSALGCLQDAQSAYIYFWDKTSFCSLRHVHQHIMCGSSVWPINQRW